VTESGTTGAELTVECVRTVAGTWQVTLPGRPDLRLTVEHLEDVAERVRTELAATDPNRSGQQVVLVCANEHQHRD